MKDPGKTGGVSRRAFARVLAASSAAAPALLAQEAATQNPQREGTVAESAPFQETLVFTRKDVPARVEPFPMTQVRVLAGPFKDAQDWNLGYLNRLPADRLLHNFKVNAGLPSSATPFGGWEEPKCELRGHFTGHYLSACGLMYASTGDKDIKAKGDTMVAELAKCQEKLGGGYLSAFPTEYWDRLDARREVWAPFYTIHKIMAGMFDMYQHTGNKQALDVLTGMASWADNWTASKSEGCGYFRTTANGS